MSMSPRFALMFALILLAGVAAAGWSLTGPEAVNSIRATSRWQDVFVREVDVAAASRTLLTNPLWGPLPEDAQPVEIVPGEAPPPEEWRLAGIRRQDDMDLALVLLGQAQNARIARGTVGDEIVNGWMIDAIDETSIRISRDNERRIVRLFGADAGRP